MSDLADPLYRAAEAAALLKSNARTLERWLAQQTRQHTSERPEGGR